MKLSQVAKAVSALLATDAKPTEAQIMAACLAADKKGKDENEGLGPKEIEKAKDKAKDEKEKAEDEKDDKAEDEKEKAEDDEMDVESGMDESETVQPKKSASGAAAPAANAGKEPAKDKKGMDAAGVAALIAANDAKHAAAREVESILGVVAHDSAEAYYRAALTKLGVDTANVHASALRSILKLARDKLSAETPAMAADAARVTSMAAAIPGYGRLK